jgi:hypothetical protein
MDMDASLRRGRLHVKALMQPVIELILQPFQTENEVSSILLNVTVRTADSIDVNTFIQSFFFLPGTITRDYWPLVD